MSFEVAAASLNAYNETIGNMLVWASQVQDLYETLGEIIDDSHTVGIAPEESIERMYKLLKHVLEERVDDIEILFTDEELAPLREARAASAAEDLAVDQYRNGE